MCLLLALPEPFGAGQAGSTKKNVNPLKATAPAGDPVRGKQIYKTKCAICHFDTSSANRVGPGMKGLFKAEKMARSGLAPSEETVRKLILEGYGTMEGFRGVFTREQLNDLIAYLKTL